MKTTFNLWSHYGEAELFLHIGVGWWCAKIQDGVVVG